MKFDVFLKSWQGTQLENRWQRFLIAVLVLSNLLLAVAAFSRNTVVAIQPPTLSETAEVSRNQATQPYLESWGLYLAELMGNVTPGNVSFIRVAIEPLLSPAVYQQVVDALEIQARQIREDRVTLKFQPRQVEYEYEAGHVFVSVIPWSLDHLEMNSAKLALMSLTSILSNTVQSSVGWIRMRGKLERSVFVKS